MCTAITLTSKSNEVFFGRTMDFSYDIIPKFFIIPRSFQWTNPLNDTLITDSYKFIGLGQEIDGLLGFFDGVNEMGFAAAALYFAGYAKYESISSENKNSIASINFLHYILGKCSSINDLPNVLKSIHIVGMEDPITNTVAPLHWIATDKSGRCVIIESTNKGVKIINNPIGVMTNSPDFNWHMTNLRNYMETSPNQTEKAQWNNFELTPFGQGGGTSPLPGGFTSPERFIRAAYLKTHIPTPSNSSEAINSCFHILESVSIPKGAVITKNNTYDYTKYTAFINVNTREYFYKTYDDLQIRRKSIK